MQLRDAGVVVTGAASGIGAALARRFQPVFVGDVAEAIARAVDDEAQAGQTYELGGPEVMTLKQVFEYVLETIQRKRLLIPVPFGLMKLQAQFLQYLPKPPLTPEDRKSTRLNSSHRT